MKISPLQILEIVAIAAVGFGAYKVAKYIKENGVAKTAENLTVATVKTAGEIIGIPDTNLQKCADDMAAGNKWDASFSCPLPIYAKYVASGFTPVEIPGITSATAKIADENYGHEGRNVPAPEPELSEYEKFMLNLQNQGALL